MHPVPAKSNLFLYPPLSPPPPSYAGPASPIIPQSLRPAERPRERGISRDQSLSYSQPPYLAPIKEANSPVPSLSSTTDINLNRSPAIRRSSNPESFSSSSLIYRDIISPTTATAAEPSQAHTVITTPLPSSHFHLPLPDLSRAFESEDEEEEEDSSFYMENTSTTIIQNGQQQQQQQQYQGLPNSADSDASFAASFYYNYSPIQRRFRHPPPPPPPPPPPLKIIPLRPPTGASAFYAAPVRGAGYYSIRRDTQ